MSQLKIQNLLVATATDHVLVDDLSFELLHGGRLGLLGESGSGKSLTALAIMGLLGEDLKVRGSIKFEEQELLGENEEDLCAMRGSGVGIIFQDSLASLDPVMKIGRQLRRVLRKYQGIRGDLLGAGILNALAEVKISNPKRTANSYPHQISGGERQRVAISLALACQPKILIADEITTSLDVIVQSEILTLLDSIIRQRGMSLIFITHDLAVAVQIIEEVIILREGKIIESGRVEDVLAFPKSRYVTDLIQSARSLDHLLDRIKFGDLK